VLRRINDYLVAIGGLVAVGTAVIVGHGTVPAWLFVAVTVDLGLVALERHERLTRTQQALAQGQRRSLKRNRRRA
jgi:hypothetical protein